MSQMTTQAPAAGLVRSVLMETVHARYVLILCLRTLQQCHWQKLRECKDNKFSQENFTDFLNLSSGMLLN